jgi:hypothetical protein
MSVVKVLAIVLVVAGILGLLYGGFSYTKNTHEAKIGPIDIAVGEREHVNIPLWAGIGAIVVGGILLIAPSRS